MTALFRMRRRIGIGVFFCALGAMHFLETYLAAILYLQFPFGMMISPGSAVLFTGKVVMLLLVYVREDAAAVRQPIYGLLYGNLLLVALVFVIRQHDLAPGAFGVGPDFGLMADMGWLMVWGSVLLFIDSILIILIYEQSADWLGNRTTLRIWLSAAAVLTFDQLGFFAGLHLFTDAPLIVLVSGWVAKMVAGACFSVLTGLYLRAFEDTGQPRAVQPRIAEIFDTLTYRKRYEDLLARSGRDSLTGMLNRERFETDGAALVQAARRTGQPLSLLVIDIDHFKAVNDRFGHSAGDGALRQIAGILSTTLRGTDCIYRFGGEEFAMLCPGLAADHAVRLAERLRIEVAGAPIDGLGHAITISIGVAACPDDGIDLDSLFAAADARLYRAKSAGRNRVWGGEYVPWLSASRHAAA